MIKMNFSKGHLNSKGIQCLKFKKFEISGFGGDADITQNVIIKGTKSI